MQEEDVLLGVADCARLLGVVPARVRRLADQGKIPVRRTTSGSRLFRTSDVELVRIERMKSRRAGVPSMLWEPIRTIARDC
jgi:DNA-binding transcriptional MerR regulator